LNDSGFPVSDSISSGMRDLSPELTTFERNGPLTIPSAVSSSVQQQPTAPPADDFDDFPHQ
jgi:hypothetical protein